MRAGSTSIQRCPTAKSSSAISDADDAPHRARAVAGVQVVREGLDVEAGDRSHCLVPEAFRQVAGPGGLVGLPCVWT